MEVQNVDVSVIIPVFNGERFIGKLITCLKAQIYTNAEFIIVNDGSIDDTEMLVLQETATDMRFKYFKQSNKGVSTARNLGLDHASGKYVTFIDADDAVIPDYLKLLVQGITYPRTNLAAVNVSGEIVNLSNRVFIDDQAYLVLYEKLKGYVWGKIFIKSVIDANQLQFDENLRVGEDLKFVFDYALTFQNNFQLNFIDNKAYLYQKRNDSATHQDTFSFYYNLSIVNNYLIQKIEKRNMPILLHSIISNFLYFYYKQLALITEKKLIVPPSILKQRHQNLKCCKKLRLKIFLWQHFPLICRYVSNFRVS